MRHPANRLTRALRLAPLFLVVYAAAGAATPAYGQVPSGGDPGDIMERFARRASKLVPEILEAIEKPIYPYFVDLAWIIAGLVAVFSFLRVTRHQEGTTSDTVWWFTRFAICLAFLLGTNDILSYMAGLGHNVAFGPDNNNSFLGKLVDEQQYSFDVSYRKFLENHFVVKVQDVEFHIQGSNGSRSFNWLSVFSGSRGNIDDIMQKIDPQRHDLDTLFTTFSISRTLLEGADLFLIIISYVVMFALRLSAPFMVALAIDRQIAGRIFQNYVWGAIVLTLVLPSVSQITRIIAYGFGNVAMALGDGDPLFRWDAETLTVISGYGNPWYTIVLASFMMLVVALGMFASPYISYKLCVGQVFESVSQVTAGWVAAIASTGVEMFSTAGAAALNRQAENTVAQGQADSGRVEATANRDAQVKRIEGQAIMSKTANNAAAYLTAKSAMADASSQAATYRNTAAGMNQQLDVITAQTMGENRLGVQQGNTHRTIENGAYSQHQVRDMRQSTANMAAGMANANPSGMGGHVGRVGIGLNPIGTAAAAEQGLVAVQNSQDRMAIHDRSTHQHNQTDVGINEQRNTILAQSKGELQAINTATQEKNAQQALAAGGAKASAAYASAGMANAGVEKWKGMSIDAEGIVIDGRMKSIDINLDAAKQAADLRAQAALVGQIGRSVAQRVDEMGDQLRY